MHSTVLDTNVLAAALRSRRGASFAILSELGKSWTPLTSVPLILEYEAVARRETTQLKIPEHAVEAVVRVLTPPEFLRIMKKEEAT
jgi:predicted nucleic acid-binding protein